MFQLCALVTCAHKGRGHFRDAASGGSTAVRSTGENDTEEAEVSRFTE